MHELEHELELEGHWWGIVERFLAVWGFFITVMGAVLFSMAEVSVVRGTFAVGAIICMVMRGTTATSEGRAAERGRLSFIAMMTAGVLVVAYAFQVPSRH